MLGDCRVGATIGTLAPAVLLPAGTTVTFNFIWMGWLLHILFRAVLLLVSFGMAAYAAKQASRLFSGSRPSGLSGTRFFFVGMTIVLAIVFAVDELFFYSADIILSFLLYFLTGSLILHSAHLFWSGSAGLPQQAPFLPNSGQQYAPVATNVYGAPNI